MPAVGHPSDLSVQSFPAAWLIFSRAKSQLLFSRDLINTLLRYIVGINFSLQLLSLSCNVIAATWQTKVPYHAQLRCERFICNGFDDAHSCGRAIYVMKASSTQCEQPWFWCHPGCSQHCFLRAIIGKHTDLEAVQHITSTRRHAKVRTRAKFLFFPLCCWFCNPW